MGDLFALIFINGTKIDNIYEAGKVKYMRSAKQEN